MELIPILATIILMATISTFFLAIGAYVLYKIRERKGVKKEVTQPQTIQAELVTPEVVTEQVVQQEPARIAAPVVFERPKAPSYKPQMEPIFVQRKTPVPVTPPQQVRAMQQPAVQQKQEAAHPGPAPVQGQPAEQKFMKFTSEGYVSTKEEKKQGNVKWR